MGLEWPAGAWGGDRNWGALQEMDRGTRVALQAERRAGAKEPTVIDVQGHRRASPVFQTTCSQVLEKIIALWY